MPNSEIDSDNRYTASLNNFFKRHIILFVGTIGGISIIFINEYYPMITEKSSEIFLFCEKCWGILTKII